MIRKLLLLVLAAVCLVGVMPAFAQDEEPDMMYFDLPSCTEDELATTIEALATITDSYSQVAALGADGTPDGMTASIVGFDTLSQGYWAELYPQVPFCLEAQDLAFNIGLMVDESLIANGLARLALYENDNGNADVAATLVQYAQARAENLQASVQAYFASLTDGIEPMQPLPACTDDDMASDGFVAWQEATTAYQDLGTLAAQAAPEDWTALVTGYADLSATYWSAIYPNLPACAEAYTWGYNTGLVFDQSLIISIMTGLGQYEAAVGNADVAQTYADSVAVRLETLMAAVNYLFGEPAA